MQRAVREVMDAHIQAVNSEATYSLVEPMNITPIAVFTEQIFDAISQYQSQIGLNGKKDKKFTELTKSEQNELYRELLEGLNTFEQTNEVIT